MPPLGDLIRILVHISAPNNTSNGAAAKPIAQRVLKYITGSFLILQNKKFTSTWCTDSFARIVFFSLPHD